MNYGPCLERLVVGDRVGVKRTAEGGLRLVINSEDAGLACPGVKADTRAVFSLAGTCVAITVTSTQKVRKQGGQEYVVWLEY